jgi:hypothetical protein
LKLLDIISLTGDAAAAAAATTLNDDGAAANGVVTTASVLTALLLEHPSCELHTDTLLLYNYYRPSLRGWTQVTSTVQVGWTKIKQSHWSVMISTCSYVGG